MALIKNKRVMRVVLEFEDGTIEQTVFGEVSGYYHERTNTHTERDPRKSAWVEHTVFWTSGKAEEERDARLTR